MDMGRKAFFPVSGVTWTYALMETCVFLMSRGAESVLEEGGPNIEA